MPPGVTHAHIASPIAPGLDWDSVAMSIQIDVGGINVQVTAQPLTQEAYAPFGDVITNPRPDVHPSAYESRASSLPANAYPANQGSAIQYRDVSRIGNLYSQAPRGSASVAPKMSMFISAARDLGGASTAGTSDPSFTVKVMERHPYTTQTFIPLASSASEYLVIVAPSLATSAADMDLPVPLGPSLPGRGLPDVRGLRAFVARSNQAVTYGAGTWHAPMVVLGEPGTVIDFVVFQFASGEAVEDCQLVHFESPETKEPRINVTIPIKKIDAKL